MITISPITNLQVGTYEKFEVGVALDDLPMVINPYDSDEIDVYAEFYSPP